jgi:transcriptional regulator with XRE-family HTH domain
MPATTTVELRKARIRQRRKELGLSMIEVAQRTGYSLSLIYKIEAGYAPSAVVAWYLAQALKLPPEEITVDGVHVPEPVIRPDRVTRVRLPAMSP